MAHPAPLNPEDIKAGWVAHEAGPCPVSPETLVHVRYEDGTDDAWTSPATAGWWDAEEPEGSNWHSRDGDSGIIAYRVVQA